MDHGKLIREDIGGAAKLAAALRARGVAVEDVTVRSWTLEGRRIPPGYWVHVVAIAAALGVACTLEDLARSVAIPGHGPELPLSSPVPSETSTPAWLTGSADNGAEIIGEGEADSPRPFVPPSSPTCSPTSAPPPSSAASPASSMPGVEAA